MTPVEERFWSKVDKQEGDTACWLWSAGKDPDGYGRFRLDGRPRLAHVVAWELEHGPVAPGRKVHHVSSCPTRACVRPEHLTAGDQADAIRARDARGNAPAGERNGRAKLTAAQVAELRAAAAARGGARTADLAERFGIHQVVVQDIIAGRLWAEGAPRKAARKPAGGGRPGRAFDCLRADELRRAGRTIREIAAALGVPRSIVARALVPKPPAADKDPDKEFGRIRPIRGSNGR